MSNSTRVFPIYVQSLLTIHRIKRLVTNQTDDSARSNTTFIDIAALNIIVLNNITSITSTVLLASNSNRNVVNTINECQTVSTSVSTFRRTNAFWYSLILVRR